MSLEILYHDDYMVAVNKPHGLLVHRSGIAADAREFAVQLVRDMVGQKVYPVHRLDRKTSGVLLFALDPVTLRIMHNLFDKQLVKKTYVAVVRGYCTPEGEIDYPLRNEKGKLQTAVTIFRLLCKTELLFPSGSHPTSRYSLLSLHPLTGRHHQIRKHLAHINHPIIADRPHGCNKQNKLFLEKFGLSTMLLHASELCFEHPVTGEYLKIRAPLHAEFHRMLEVLELNCEVGE